MPVKIRGERSGYPDYTREIWRSAQPTLKGQYRLWGWVEIDVPAGTEMTWIIWNAPEVPAGAPGFNAYEENCVWIVRDCIITSDSSILLEGRFGVCWWDGTDVWITGEVGAFGYGKIDFKLSDGFKVEHSQDLTKPYGLYVSVYNNGTSTIKAKIYINGLVYRE